MDPRGTFGSIYIEEYYTLLHTKYESSGPCDFGGDFFMFFPMTPPGRGLYGPQAGAQLAGFIRRTATHKI